MIHFAGAPVTVDTDIAGGNKLDVAADETSAHSSAGTPFETVMSSPCAD